MGIQLSPEGVHGFDGICIGDCPGISAGLGLGAAFRLVVLRAVLFVAVRVVLLARLDFPFAARFRATLLPPCVSW